MILIVFLSFLGLLISLWLLKASRRFIEGYKMVLVLRQTRFHRVAGPGRFWIIPFRDSVGPTIELRTRQEDYRFQSVMTHDGIPYTFHVTVAFRFNPSHASDLAIQQAVWFTPADWRRLVGLWVESTLLDIVADFPSETVCTQRSNIRRDLIRSVQQTAREWGIVIRGGDIILTRIEPPVEWIQANLERMHFVQMQEEIGLDQIAKLDVVEAIRKNKANVHVVLQRTDLLPLSDAEPKRAALKTRDPSRSEVWTNLRAGSAFR